MSGITLIPEGWNCVRCCGTHEYCVNCGDYECVEPDGYRGPRALCVHDNGALRLAGGEQHMKTRYTVVTTKHYNSIRQAERAAGDRHKKQSNDRTVIYRERISDGGQCVTRATVWENGTRKEIQ